MPRTVPDPRQQPYGELDLRLIAEGRHERPWTVLGAHPLPPEAPTSDAASAGPASGVRFTVWAPNAREVRVIGDFAGWGPYDGAPMRPVGGGIWEAHIPEAKPGDRYKYRIHGIDGGFGDKADPYAFAAEAPPKNASVIYRSEHTWGDAEWMRARQATPWHERPVSIYELHLGSWRPGLSYRQLADELVEYVAELGFTHVELLPVAEHPYGGSWGYQGTSYFAPTARHGSPDDFRHLVDQLHQAGIGVILDWVPAHFPRDEWALARFDGAPLYEHPDPRRGEQPDWGTYVFDYGRPQVRNFLVANALYWLEEFHIDGLRVDAVASMLYLDYSRGPGQWTPNVHGGREHLEAVSLLQEVNAAAYREHPGVMMIAEESTAWPGVTRPVDAGGLGFGFKWNMGWMHDTLGYFSKDPIYRAHHHHQLSFGLTYAWSENFVLPISHDEVVHGKGSLYAKMPGDERQKLANLRALLAYMWAHPGKQLLFSGCEFAQASEWSEEHGLDWSWLDDPGHAGVRRLVADLNRIYRGAAALWSADTQPGGFSWIDPDDAAHNVVTFLRHPAATPASHDQPAASGSDRPAPAVDGRPLACLANFSGVEWSQHPVDLPHPGRWVEVLNTDAIEYGGAGLGNLGGVEAHAEPHQGMPASALVNLPPLSVIWLRPHTP